MRRGWACAIGLVGLLGCGGGGGASKVEKPFAGMKVGVAALGDPAILEPIRARRGEWERRTGASIAFLTEPFEKAGADVLLFSGERMGELVDRRALAVLQPDEIRPREPSDPKEAPRDERDPLVAGGYLPAFRDQVARYGEDWMGLPLGGSALVLVYRREAFEGGAGRTAIESAGLKPEPPRTWEQLDTLARALHGRDWDGDGRPDPGIALALGRDEEGVGDAVFLSRAAALGLHPDQYSFLFDADTLAPRLAEPPFVEALAGLAALRAHGPEGVASFDAAKAAEAFRAGRAALLIDRAERASRWADPKRPMRIGVAPLPGSSRVYDPDRKTWQALKTPNRPSYLPIGGGWLVGVSAAATGVRRTAALDLAKHLAGPEMSPGLIADPAFPMLPTRESQLGQGLPDPSSAPGVDPRLWGMAVASTLTAPRVEPGLRVPGADRLLADLGRARAEVASGRRSAEEALRALAERWSKDASGPGARRRLWHYRRSLNRVATETNPPPAEPGA